MFEDFGAETSKSGWSMHTEAHGEFGVTCKAEEV